MLEKASLTLGYIPLTDCAPLIVAQELDFFKKRGLGVTLKAEASWANLRDDLLLGELDAAHMLAPMPLAATLGVASPRHPVITALGLALNGNAITLAKALYGRLLAQTPAGANPTGLATALKRVITEDRKYGRPPISLAVVFPVSNHYYQLRHWLLNGGIDPERDLRIVVVPPPRMVEALRGGEIEGFCVGEPWNSLAAIQGVGVPVVGSLCLWNNVLEKVLGVREDWAARYPNTHRALLRAVLEASRWLDTPYGRREAPSLLSPYLGVETEVMALSLQGRVPGLPSPSPDFHVFQRYAANFPWRSHALWFLRQMAQAGQLPAGYIARAIAERVFRPDIYREAVVGLDEAVPMVDALPLGLHGEPWPLEAASPRPIVMGSDHFFDGQVFNP